VITLHPEVIKFNESHLEKTDVKIHRYGKALFETDTNNFLVGVSKNSKRIFSFPWKQH